MSGSPESEVPHLPEDPDAEFLREDLREDLRHRRWLVFVGLIVATAALAGLAWMIAGAPTCENPDNNWMPCWSLN